MWTSGHMSPALLCSTPASSAAYDMTTEAAFTKMHALHARGLKSLGASLN